MRKYMRLYYTLKRSNRDEQAISPRYWLLPSVTS
jgi:hypothetical protein